MLHHDIVRLATALGVILVLFAVLFAVLQS